MSTLKSHFLNSDIIYKVLDTLGKGCNCQFVGFCKSSFRSQTKETEAADGHFSLTTSLRSFSFSRSLANGGTGRPRRHLMWSRAMPTSKKQGLGAPWWKNPNPRGKRGSLECVAVSPYIARVFSSVMVVSKQVNRTPPPGPRGLLHSFFENYLLGIDFPI